MDTVRDFSSTSPKSKYVKIQDQPRSQIDPIPYYPNLHRQLHSLNATLLLTYLEIHYPAPQDDPEASVTIDADTITRDLQTARRTLLVSLSILSVFWRGEEARARGARANREFLQPDHSRHGTTKPYSITGPKTWKLPGTAWTLRRNTLYLRHILQQASPLIQDPLTPETIGGNPTCGLMSLGEMIVKASVLGRDGRETKAERMREAHLGKFSK